MAVRSVGSVGGRSTSSRVPRRRAGKVELAARRALREIDTDHAASELLVAIAARLAQDIDSASEVRDRVAASKELREVLDVLDTAVVPPRMPGVMAAGGVDDGDDDPFEIGSVPPGLGDAEAV